MRLIVTGSRHFSYHAAPLVNAALTNVATMFGLPYRITDPDLLPTIVHGDARGVDTMAKEFALAQGWRHEAHPADWNTYGKAAGPIRNQHMVATGADVCLGFPYGLEHENTSRGSWQCLRCADDADIPTIYVYQQRFFALNVQGAQVLLQFGMPVQFPEH